MRVNFVDLKKQVASIRPEIEAALGKVLDSCAFTNGPFVQSFEENFAKAHDVAYCLAVNNGTAALHVAMMGLGIGPGDEVIVPTNTFFATPEAVSLTGAKPVFVDCDEATYNIDIDAIEGAITSKTRAIIAVHLYGQPVAMDRVVAVAKRHDLTVIEDCAQAHLARFKGKSVGSWGKMGCFSFYPGKNLGAYGEGGAVTTDDEQLYNKLRALRDHGAPAKFQHTFIGHNYRMSGFQGAVLDVKLQHLAKWTQTRQRNAELYAKYLSEVPGITLPQTIDDATHVYHLYVVRVPNRDDLRTALGDQSIASGIHYPVPCHLQGAYTDLNHARGDFPVAERVADEIVSLPMCGELTEEQIVIVAEAVNAFYRR